jgi:ribosomal protein S18 acetylase RimI-like enzyme
MSQRAAVAAVRFRPAVPADRAVLRAFVDHDVAGTPYAEVPAYFLRLALEGRATESRAIVAERGADIVGFALFGEVAGAVGTGRMHFITVTASSRLHTIGAGLCEAAVADLASHGVRFIVAELPDDPVVASGRALLARCGFVEVAHVPDYYRDGIALLVLQRPA